MAHFEVGDFIINKFLDVYKVIAYYDNTYIIESQILFTKVHLTAEGVKIYNFKKTKEEDFCLNNFKVFYTNNFNK